MRDWAISVLVFLAMGSPALASVTAPTTCDHPPTVTIPAAPTEPYDVYEAVYQSELVVIKVLVSAKGSLTSAWIVQSSGRVDVDQQALRAARESKFAPAMKNCKPVSGMTLFRVGYGSSNNIFILRSGGGESRTTNPPG